MSKIVVSISNAKNKPDSATVGVVIANAGLTAGQEVYLWLTLDGVYLSQKGYSDGVVVEGFKPLAELIDTFIHNGGQIVVCTPCFKVRQLAEDKLIGSTVLAGAARLIELLSQGAACISY